MLHEGSDANLKVFVVYHFMCLDVDASAGAGLLIHVGLAACVGCAHYPAPLKQWYQAGWVVHVAAYLVLPEAGFEHPLRVSTVAEWKECQLLFLSKDMHVFPAECDLSCSPRADRHDFVEGGCNAVHGPRLAASCEQFFKLSIRPLFGLSIRTCHGCPDVPHWTGVRNDTRTPGRAPGNVLWTHWSRGRVPSPVEWPSWDGHRAVGGAASGASARGPSRAAMPPRENTGSAPRRRSGGGARRRRRVPAACSAGAVWLLTPAQCGGTPVAGGGSGPGAEAGERVSPGTQAAPRAWGRTPELLGRT